jgi:5-formyltetrahydrofolate cyclo-ligase
MTKSELRLMLRARRRAFVADLPSGADRRELELAVAGQVLARLGSATIIAAYLSNGMEVDPLPALEAAEQRGLPTALPHLSDRDAPMRFLRWAPGDPLVDGPFGLRQPPFDAPELFPDLILAPLVGFDRGLRRLGQGAAFYDRAFASLPGARRIGLAWSVQEVDRLPADPWDVPLHAVATEKEWIEAYA